MAVFIKISETFILSNSKDKDLPPEYKKPIVARFKEIKAETFCFVPFKKFMIFDKTPLKKYGHLIFLNAKK